MPYLLDTNILSALVRAPRGPVAERIRQAGEAQVYTSVIVAAELRYGAARKGSDRLLRQVEAVLGSPDGTNRPTGLTRDCVSHSSRPGRRSVVTTCSSGLRRSPMAAFW